MTKLAQAKMMETVMVLVVFFILLMLGLGFYAYTRMTSVQRDYTETFSLESIQVAQAVNYLPELRCYRQGIVVENCIDIYKAKAFSTLMNESDSNILFYFDQFKHSQVILTELYPGNETIVIYDYSNNTRGGRATNIPITIWDPVKDANAFAMLSVRYMR